MDHLLFHCVKTRALWEMFFSLFRVLWVVLSSVRETLLSWNGSFVGKKCKKVWRMGPFCIFWTVWKARNIHTFEDDVLSIQRLKGSFVYLLWSETNLFIKDGSSMLINFIDWVGSSWGLGCLLYILLDSFLFQLLRGWVYLSCIYWAAFLALLFNTISFLIKKIYTM